MKEKQEETVNNSSWSWTLESSGTNFVNFLIVRLVYFTTHGLITGGSTLQFTIFTLSGRFIKVEMAKQQSLLHQPCATLNRGQIMLNVPCFYVLIMSFQAGMQPCFLSVTMAQTC